MKLRLIIGALFLILQIAGIVYSRFTPLRFFCWAPYDIQTKFEATGKINGKILNSDQLKERYKYKMSGWEQRSIFNIFSLIEQYESTYGKNDKAEITIKYSINGHPEKIWILK
ncbi:hypothetical protein N1F78_14630 [Seonamhaeicola sp. MEBiC1930]|uniref:hypothetical protein n=1 Tax=Seonamhaeicola sp. MEBiC01930 TaxID=2976768 RepID=UPI00324A8726